MTMLNQLGDGITAERILCIFRKMTKPVLIASTHKHRAQTAKVYGLPAEAYVDKPFRKL